MKKYLFVCAHNVVRSKIGEKIFRNYLNTKNKEARVFSRGIKKISFFLGRRISKKDLENITKIIVMENWMEEYITKKFNVKKEKIINLNIKDNYGPLRPKKISELKLIFNKINWEKIL